MGSFYVECMGQVEKAEVCIQTFVFATFIYLPASHSFIYIIDSMHHILSLRFDVISLDHPTDCIADILSTADLTGQLLR